MHKHNEHTPLTLRATKDVQLTHALVWICTLIHTHPSQAVRACLQDSCLQLCCLCLCKQWDSWLWEVLPEDVHVLLCTHSFFPTQEYVDLFKQIKMCLVIFACMVQINSLSIKQKALFQQRVRIQHVDFVSFAEDAMCAKHACVFNWRLKARDL